MPAAHAAAYGSAHHAWTEMEQERATWQTEGVQASGGVLASTWRSSRAELASTWHSHGRGGAGAGEDLDGLAELGV